MTVAQFLVHVSMALEPWRPLPGPMRAHLSFLCRDYATIAQNLEESADPEESFPQTPEISRLEG